MAGGLARVSLISCDQKTSASFLPFLNRPLPWDFLYHLIRRSIIVLSSEICLSPFLNNAFGRLACLYHIRQNLLRNLAAIVPSSINLSIPTRCFCGIFMTPEESVKASC